MNEEMTVYLYASSMWRAVNCPGSVKAQGHGQPRGKKVDLVGAAEERAIESSGTPEAVWGRDLHKLMEEVLGGLVEVEAIDEPERTWVERCIQFLKERGIEGGLTEKRLFVLGPRGVLLASCRADLISVSDGVVTIPDWKFYREGLEEAEWEWQAKTMCIAALQEYPDCHTATAIAYLPVLDRSYEFTLDREGLEEPLGKITETYYVANTHLPHRHLQPGPWCARCSALATCPAVGETLSELAKQVNLEAIRGEGKIPTVSVMKTGFYGEIEKWSRGRFRGAVELLPFLPALTEAIRLRLREELGQGINHNNWELKPKSLPRKGSVADVRGALLVHFTSDEWESVLKPSFGEIQRVLKAKGVAEEEIRYILEPFEQGKTEELRRVK